MVEAFRKEQKLGLLAGKIKDYRDGRERLLLPFGKASLLAHPNLPGGRHKVSYFLAGCYAVRRAAVETCGGYRPEMKYGEEELDLSYRLIAAGRSEEHTSELQSLMRNSYAVFCLKNKK